jgi:thiol-disulfide isomerase/thioredoxin
MARLTTVLVFLACMFTATAANAGNLHSQENDNDVKLISVSLYAEWCGSCKHLDAMLDDIKREFEEGNILFIYLDKTTDFDVNQSRKKAKMLGFEDVSNKYEGRTGLVLLIDPDSGELLKEITASMSAEDIKAALAEHSKR